MFQSCEKSKGLLMLIDAVEFVEKQDKKERDEEHGYAAPYEYESKHLTTKLKVVRRGHNRTSHNELEKNRRAHLRQCLDNLKAIVPLKSDATKHTTLGLLNQARELIKGLTDQEQSLLNTKMQECKKNALLKRTLMQLEKSRARRSSTGSGWSSGHSESSNDSDKDEEIIDVTDCSDVADILKAPIPTRIGNRNGNLITINVPKSLTLQSRSLMAGVKRTLVRTTS